MRHKKKPSPLAIAIRAHLERTGKSQRELAREAKLWPARLSEILNGGRYADRPPALSAADAARLSAATGIPLAVCLGIEETARHPARRAV